MIRHLLSRMGCLFLMIGIILLVLGIAAESSGQPAFNFIFLGVLLLIGGFFLWSKLRRKPRRSTRFSLFHKRENEEKEQDNQDDQGWGDSYYD